MNIDVFLSILSSPWFLGFMGLLWGSFANVIILRLLEDKSLNGRSHCPICQHTLGPLDLIPILSYIFLRGKCRYCGAHISLQYPVIEGLMSALWCGGSMYFGLSIELLLYLGFSFLLVVLSAMDLAAQTVDDRVIIVGVIWGIATQWLSGNLSDALWGAGAGVGVSFAVYAFGMFWSRLRGYDEPSFGSGDITASLMIGVFLGPFHVLLAFYTGMILFGLLALTIYLICRTSISGLRMPFVPSLALAAFIQFFWSDSLYDLLQQLLVLY